MSNLSSVFSTLQGARPHPATARPWLPVSTAEVPTELLTALRQMELLVPGDRPRVTPLASGSLSQVYRVDLAWGTICAKHALTRSDPTAPLERTAFEVRWLKLAREVVPDCAPEVLGEHAATATFVMEYLDPARFPTWAKLLDCGIVQPSVAAETGHLLGRLHAASSSSPAVMQRFEADHILASLVVEPVFRQTARAHPALATRLHEAEADFMKRKVALVHGSFAPDNVLVGPRGPMLIDADRACYGDPIFDVATCLAELLLHGTGAADPRACAAAFDAFRLSYLSHVTWEMHEHAEQRTAHLVPVLLLAAVDGGEPSGLVSSRSAQRRVRERACALLKAPVDHLEAVRDAWLAP